MHHISVISVPKFIGYKTQQNGARVLRFSGKLTRCTVVISCRRIGTTYRASPSRVKESRFIDRWMWYR